MRDAVENLPDYLRPGNEYVIGEYTFRPDEIIEFAQAYDPQPFHIDADAAKESLFGGLCASGWHTVSVWMKLQRQFTEAKVRELQSRGHPFPIYGPSPGMENLKWLKPVFAGETITFSNMTMKARESRSKPGMFILTPKSMARDKNGQMVMEFESSVFLQIGA